MTNSRAGENTLGGMDEPLAHPSHEPTRQVVLGLGANLGDRIAALQAAIDVICADPQVVATAVSRVYETDPVGGPEQPDYFNAVLVVESTLPPVEVLALAQLAETHLHRERLERWGPRTLDVDVLNIDGVTSDDPTLTLPHPRAAQRAFVLVPLSDVAPALVMAGQARTVESLCADLPAADRAGVRLRADLALAIPPAGTSE